MAQQLGLAEHTTFTGKIPYRQARDYLALGDVAVAPKLSATEGSGKILNYMAMGLPTVAFETPVSREYLGDDGIYATPGDPQSLAEALLRGLEELAAPPAAHRSQSLRRTAREHVFLGPRRPDDPASLWVCLPCMTNRAIMGVWQGNLCHHHRH